MMTLPISKRELVLAVALFFNPLGYNELFRCTMLITGSYWATSACFYAIAFGLFLVYLFMGKGKDGKAC